mgnify:CR=1 FL=1
MTEAIISRIARPLFDRGISHAESKLAAVGLLTAWHEEPNILEARQLLHRFSKRLEPKSHFDGLDAAQGWLDDPGFSATHWEAMDQALRQLSTTSKSPIDWTAEFSASLVNDGRWQFGFNLPMAIARSIARVLDLPLSESCACIFPSAATLAWSLSGDREVTFVAGDQYVAIISALFARAACRTLRVDRRNPLDGSFMPAHVVDETPSSSPPPDRYDHVVSLPYFGLRVRDGAAKGALFEALQIERLAHRATKTFSTIIPDGLLFRENKHESMLRRRLIDEHATTVMSLPSGMFLPSTGISTSLLTIDRDEPGGAVRVINGRTMDSPTTGKMQEQFIVRHLESFRGLAPKDEDRVEIVERDELDAANFSLLPERYLRSENQVEVEAALKDRQQVSLDEVTSVERSKAPIQIRGEVEDPPLTAMEIAPGDIVDGRVTTPKRQLAFEKDQASALAKVTVERGDILVSIKGNIGIVGIADIDAMVAKLSNKPWIVSQSLAIVRLQDRDRFASPEVLNAILTAPWVREKLESMSGGSTVRTLPISALRSLTLPVPTADEIVMAQGALDQIESLRKQIAALSQNQADAQSALWHQLWHLAPEIGED